MRRSNPALIDAEYRRQFQEYTGVRSTDRSLNVFSEDEEVERYARAMAFWDIKRAEAGDDYTRVMISSQSRVSTMHMIERFPEALQIRIFARCRELTGL